MYFNIKKRWETVIFSSFGLFITCFCLIQFSSQAQGVITDSLYNPKDSVVLVNDIDTIVFVSGKRTVYSFGEHFKYKVSGDGLFTRGNIYRTLLIGRGAFIYSTPVVDISLTPTYTYGENNYLPAENDYMATLFGDFYEKEPIYFWVMGLGEHSRSRGIDARSQVGAGIGFNFSPHTDSSALFLTTGIIHEMTAYRGETRIETWRNSTRLKGRHWIFDKKLKVTYELYLQPSIIDIDNFRMRFVAALEYPFNKWAAFRTSFQDSYESIVLPGKVSNDFTWTFGLSIGRR